jgi:hypothetical protein
MDKLTPIQVNKLLMEETQELNYQISKLKDKINSNLIMPVFNEEFTRKGFVFIYPVCNDKGIFGIGKKVKVNFTHYTVNMMCSELPKELKHEVDGYLVACFHNSGFCEFRLLKTDLTAYPTFHTDYSYGKVCLGDLDELDFIRKMKIDIESLNIAFNEIIKLLSVLNPSSFYNNHFRANTKLEEIYLFVKNEYENKTVCVNCHNLLRDCSCSNDNNDDNDNEDTWYCEGCNNPIGSEHDGYWDNETHEDNEGNTVCDNCGRRLD